MSRKGGSQPGRTPSPNDQRSNTLNPNNPAYKAARDNRSNQMNPNNPEHPTHRTDSEPQKK